MKLADYERFFEADGASFLFATIYFKAYEDLNCLMVMDSGVLTVWLDLSKTSMTRKNGLALISDAEAFSDFLYKFDRFINEADEKFEKYLINNIFQTENFFMN